MGYIDDPSLLQKIIDTLNLKQLPGEVQLPYPLPVFPGVSQVINLNDFLKTRKSMVVKSHSFTADLAAGAQESFTFQDLFTEAETKNKIYGLVNLGALVLPPPSSTTGTHSADMTYQSPAGEVYLFMKTVAYNGSLALQGNQANVGTYTLLSKALQGNLFNWSVGFNQNYFNDTDVVQSNPRTFEFVFVEEVVRGL